MKIINFLDWLLYKIVDGTGWVCLKVTQFEPLSEIENKIAIGLGCFLFLLAIFINFAL